MNSTLREFNAYSKIQSAKFDGTVQTSQLHGYRAATVDGNNAIFLISEHEEQRLAAGARLVKDRQLGIARVRY